MYTGQVIALRRDEVSMPGGTTGWRDIVEHPGAVAVVALDDHDCIVVVRQYRHAVGRRIDEIPAGLLDQPGETAFQAAHRELAEEAGLAADTWHVLVDVLTSPGMTDEAVRIFLARGLRAVPRDVQQHEEAELTSTRVPLADLVTGLFAGRYENALLAAGVLAASAARADRFRGLRPPNASWPARR